MEYIPWARRISTFGSFEFPRRSISCNGCDLSEREWLVEGAVMRRVHERGGIDLGCEYRLVAIQA